MVFDLECLQNEEQNGEFIYLDKHEVVCVGIRKVTFFLFYRKKTFFSPAIIVLIWIRIRSVQFVSKERSLLATMTDSMYFLYLWIG